MRQHFVLQYLYISVTKSFSFLRVGHNLIVSHASVVKLYRDEFKAIQGGQIGITLNGDWQMPYDDKSENVIAAQHALDFAIGWYADPIYLGYYPPYMREVLQDRLPQFTPDESVLVKGSSDFYGMNTYTTNLARAGGDDEFQGLVDYTFTRPDGTQLGMQGLPSRIACSVKLSLEEVQNTYIRHGKRVRRQRRE